MIDGPYIYDLDDNRLLVVQVLNNQGELIVERTPLNKNNAAKLKCFIDDESGDFFEFELKEHTFLPPVDIYTAPERMLVLSDIEGNFYAFKRLLTGNGVMDEHYNWCFGKGHLVLNGDFVDRGKNVIPLLWLIYKLEFQAEAQGGTVHFILGNHEDFFITWQTKYVHPKYIEIAKATTKVSNPKEAFSFLNNKYLVLRKWLLSKNTIEKIGDILFVHAGISAKMLELEFAIEDINQLVRKGMPRDPIKEEEILPVIKLLFGSYGPLWYRGFVFDYKYYKKDTEADIQKVLDFFDVNHIVIGHNMVPEISSDFNKKLYRIDVQQSDDRTDGDVSGLLIEKGQFFRVNDKGTKELI